MEVACSNCGELTDKPKYKVERNENNFCSQECYHTFRKGYKTGEDSPLHKEKVALECEQCGSEFKVHQYRKDSARFCSRECSDDYKVGKTGPETSRWKGGKKTFVCMQCGQFFKAFDRDEKRKYCSKSCYREASKELFKGENNPVWRGGWERYYGPNWKEQRQKAIERDDHRCRDCGKHADDMARSPDVHHKKRLGWFKEEYDRPEWWERANRLDNLVTLWASCHKKREWSAD